jgi:hypothetical protein
MKSVKNKESPTNTILGGMVVKPKAWRSKENTISIRVKLVIKINAAGKKVSAVKAKTVSTGTAKAVPPPVCLDVIKGKAWLKPSLGNNIMRPVTTSKPRNLKDLPYGVN